VIDTLDGLYTADAMWTGMVREDVTALLASTFPVKPPRGWFENPQFTAVTPMTVQSDGRVMGHVAGWRDSHIGMAGGVKAPRSKSNYAFFSTGAIECDDGSYVNVGQVTLAGGHAPLEASVAEAVAHYDNTKSAVMDVTAGEDDYGIWVAGALRPEVNEMQLRSIRASSVSGDWRPINGNLELVAVCAVNVPGFPIPRARVASGQVVALVAAGTEELVSQAIMDRVGADVMGIVTGSVGAVSERLALVEDALLNRVRERREQIADAVAAVVASGSSAAAAADLRARVHAVTAAAGDTSWVDGAPIENSTAECLQASLRARVASAEIVGTASSHWKSEKRKTAAAKGQALPDGSFPVADKTDWYKARQALGRAKNRARVVRHLRSRGRTLGIPKKELDSLHATA
jgi:hypothetical protein